MGNGGESGEALNGTQTSHHIQLDQVQENKLHPADPCLIHLILFKPMRSLDSSNASSLDSDSHPRGICGNRPKVYFFLARSLGIRGQV